MSGPQASRSPLDYAMLLGAAVIYGAVFSVNKIAATGGAPPLAYAFWQSFGAGLVLWIVLTLRGERLSVSRPALTSYIVIGALVIGIPISLLTYIAPKLPAGNHDLGASAVATVHFHHERGSARRALSLARPDRSLVRLCRRGADRGTGRECGGTDRLAVVPSGAARAGHVRGSNIAAALLQPPASSSVATAAGVLFGSALVLLPVMLIAGQAWVPTRLDQAAIGTLLAIAINAAFLVLFLEIIRRAGPVFFAQFNYLAVLAGVAWGAVIFGERLSIYVILAMVLMFVGVFLSGYRRPPAVARRSNPAG